MVYSYTTTMYRLTATYEIWDDDDGDIHLEVGEDAEGLDQVEIREYIHGVEEDDPDEVSVIGCTPEQAGALVEAIAEFLVDQETVTVTDEESGSRVEVGLPLPEEGPEGIEADADDGSAEIRQYDEEGNGVERIYCTLKQLVYIKNAIHRYLKSREFLAKNPTGMVESGPLPN
jgi:hypothetical protein